MGLSKVIDQYLKEKNMPLREFAKKCGLSHSYVNKLRKGVNPKTGQQIEPTIDTIKKVAEAMGLTLEELLIKADYINSNEYTLKGDEIPLELRKIGIEYLSLAKEVQDSEKITLEDIKSIIKIMKK